ncbi:hypothetical protein D7243_06945 [Stutzerimonas stutzeri]|nr:hypothetical protein [Stutzerimonas stutzeri]
MALSSAPPTGCASHGASLFLVWPRKSNQKEGHPCIRVLLRKTSLPPVLLRGSSRRDIHVPSLLSRHPCLEPPCATPVLGLLKGNPDRVAWSFSSSVRSKAFRWLLHAGPGRRHQTPLSGRRVGNAKLTHRCLRATFDTDCSVDRGGKCFAVFHPTASACGQSCFSIARTARRRETPLSGGRMESARRGASGMDAARGVKGHGWPLYAGPRSGDGMREVSRSETRMEGQDFLVPFGATAKRNSPSRAKPMRRLTEPMGCTRRAPSPNTSRQRCPLSKPHHPANAFIPVT